MKEIMHKSKKGIRQPTCMGCIPIEAVCFIYGVTSCVLSIFGIVILTLARLFVSSENIIIQYNQDTFGDMCDHNGAPGLYDSLPLTAYALLLYVCYLCSLVFSLMLCYGVHKRSPGYLKAYLVYGVTVTSLMLMSLLYLYSWLYDGVGLSVLGLACCIYSLVLRVVHRTHMLFRAERACRLAQLHGYMEYKIDPQNT